MTVLGNVKDMEEPKHHSWSNSGETHHAPISDGKYFTFIEGIHPPILTQPSQLTPFQDQSI